MGAARRPGGPDRLRPLPRQRPRPHRPGRPRGRAGRDRRGPPRRRIGDGEIPTGSSAGGGGRHSRRRQPRTGDGAASATPSTAPVVPSPTSPSRPTSSSPSLGPLISAMDTGQRPAGTPLLLGIATSIVASGLPADSDVPPGAAPRRTARWPSCSPRPVSRSTTSPPRTPCTSRSSTARLGELAFANPALNEVIHQTADLARDDGPLRHPGLTPRRGLPQRPLDPADLLRRRLRARRRGRSSEMRRLARLVVRDLGMARRGRRRGTSRRGRLRRGRRRARPSDRPDAEDDGVVGHGQGPVDVLLDQHHRRAAGPWNWRDGREHLVDDLRGQAERRLVEQQQARIGQRRPGPAPASAARRPTACRPPATRRSARRGNSSRAASTSWPSAASGAAGGEAQVLGHA